MREEGEKTRLRSCFFLFFSLLSSSRSLNFVVGIALPFASPSTHLFAPALLLREEEVTVLVEARESARSGGGRGWDEAVEDGCCCGVGGVGVEAICWPCCCCCFPPLLPPPKPLGLPSPAAAKGTTATRAGVVARCERPAGGARRGLIGLSTRSGVP